MPTEDPIKLSTGAVWLDPRTPQNFNAGRNLVQAQLIGLRASIYSRQRKSQNPAQLNRRWSKSASQSARQNGSAVTREVRVTPDDDDRLALDRNSRHSKLSSAQDRANNQIQDAPRLLIPSPSTVLVHGCSDPFQSAPVDLNARTYDVVKAASIFTTRATFPAETRSKFGWQIYFEDFQKYLHDFFSDEAGLQALVCFGWSVMSRLNSAERGTCLTQSFKHGAKAMEALRPAISWLDQDHDGLKKVLRIVQLHCSTAMFTGDRKAAMYHQDALKKLIGLLGGLHKLTLHHQDLIVYLIVRIALNTRTRTVLDPEEWDPGRLPVPEEGIHLAPISTTESALSGSWKVVFVALRELALGEELADRDVDLLRWCYLRRQAIKAKVANMWCDLTEPIQATDPVPGITAIPTLVHHSSLDMCLCLAVQNYVILTSEPTTLAQQTISSAQISHIMLTRCLDRLEVDLGQLEETTMPRQMDLLWVLGVGAVVEIQISSQLERPGPWINCDLEELKLSWFMLHFGLLAVRLGYESYDEVARLFERDYVYSPSVQGQILRCSFHSAAGLSAGSLASLWTFTRPSVTV